MSHSNKIIILSPFVFFFFLKKKECHGDSKVRKSIGKFNKMKKEKKRGKNQINPSTSVYAIFMSWLMDMDI
jgi:hypothetical protein